jgi:4-amino-4-deoxy-L-arabinose transferase-like glycosyltransferase
VNDVTSRVPTGFVICALAVLALALFMGFYNMSGDLMNNDEETYLYGAWRVSLGEVPYQDFLVVQTPLSFYLVAALFKVFGPSVWWARALSFSFVLGAAGLIYWASRKIFKFARAIALLGASVFIFSKHIYFLGRSFMPDCAMIFLATAALVFGLKAETEVDPHRRRRPVFLFGMLTGLATLAKLNGVLCLFGYGLFATILLFTKRERPWVTLERLAFSAAGFLATFGLVFGLMLALVPNTYYATLGIHAGKTTFGVSALVLLWLERLIRFVGNHNYGLIPVALAGIFFRPVFKDRRRLLLLMLTLATLVQILLPVVFYLRYVVFAIVPLAFFFEDGIVGLGSLKKWKWPAAVVAAVLVLICLAPTFNPRKLLAHDYGTRNVIAYVRSHTAPNDFIFGETPFANFYAQRPCPPKLVDVSEGRTKSGQVLADDIKGECERYRVKMILVEKGAAHNLANLKDYAKFEAYLDDTYDLVTSLQREFLTVYIYIRKIDR